MLDFSQALHACRASVALRLSHLETQLNLAEQRLQLFLEDCSRMTDVPVAVVEETERILRFWVSQLHIEKHRAAVDFDRIRALIREAVDEHLTETSGDSSTITQDDADNADFEWKPSGNCNVRVRKSK